MPRPSAPKRHITINDDSEDEKPVKKVRRAPAIHWGKAEKAYLTWDLIEAMADPTIRHQLWSDDRKEAKKQKRSFTTGSATKHAVHQLLAQTIFENNTTYSAAYLENKHPFALSVSNRIVR